MIDIHMHIGRLFTCEKRSMTPEYVLDFMDRHGIDRAAIMAMENPEALNYFTTTDSVLEVCAQHPDRFIPFCCYDPRRGNYDDASDCYPTLEEYRDRGCKGIGELVVGLQMDDSRMQNLYDACGKLGLPMLFHMDYMRCLDDVGLPRMEAMIKKFPDTIFIGHGPSFWAEVSADVTAEQVRSCYPSGPVKRGGAVERLLSEYPNAYAELSGRSGYTALTRDKEYGLWLLEKFQDKLLFGTDIAVYGTEEEAADHLANGRMGEYFSMEAPLAAFLREADISKEAFDKIAELNAVRILKL